MSQSATHFRTCNLCEAMCGLAIETAGQEIVAIRGDQDDVFSRGHLCPKGPALAQLHADPDRLRRPLQRTSTGWRELDWEDALDAAAAGLHRVQKDHGKDALAVYLGNPAVHNHAVVLYGPPFLRALRTRHRYSATSVDQLPQMLVAHLMFGHQLLMPVPDIDRAEHMLIVGANPLVSNGSIMSAPDVRRRLRGIQRRGGRVVVVDPRQTQTAKLADAHVYVQPGTDALLLLAMLQVIVSEGRERPGRLAAMVSGAGRVRSAVEGFTPERAAGPTGIEAERIRELARELVTRRGVVYGRVGASTQRFGALSHWAINLLNVFTGALDRVGGSMFTRPAVDPLAMPRGLGVGPGAFGRWHSRVRGLPEFGGELPVASFAEDVVAGHEDRRGSHEPLAAIRGLLTLAGNPVLSTPDGSGLGRAIERLDFKVSIDMYVNETSRYADLILPPTSPLERSHYDLVFHLLAVRNTAKWSPPLFDPPSDARHDWQILHGLWTRIDELRGTTSLVSRGVHELLGRLGPDGLIDLGLRAGPHGRVLPKALRSVPVLGRRAKGLDLASLAAQQHGVDLGPLEPCLPERMPGKGRRIELAPVHLIEDLSRLERSFPLGATGPRAPSVARPCFTLIGRRLLRSNNSWMHNLPKLVAGKPACTLLMHPSDAERLALRPGDEVRVRSRVGEVQVMLELNEGIMPGVVSLPHGFGHRREHTRLAVANEHAGVSINDLTDPREVDELSGVAALSGVRVEVELAPEPK
ncbi:Assimilatory nitrate reductase catalytic subunit [Enhygromyxa salina]|uniref:Assimilatory nitrate reductase catalytic subunit n=1 Tax=Enhygromyxa salina TaxID=215803 RepID=A0A2S9XX08_9BACT|nr:molybdopterin-dependent oxidoreductase [Enhygromyxa salina]PRP97417.1 Assimilatory nitrate reductase catalytic subunit [Enhygromyxa salina]